MGIKNCQLSGAHGWNAAGFDWQIRQTQATVKLASHDTDTQQPDGYVDSLWQTLENYEIAIKLQDQLAHESNRSYTDVDRAVKTSQPVDVYC